MMQKYLVKVTTNAGERKTLIREGTSVLHVRHQLEQEGFQKIDFLDDDFTAKQRTMRPDHLKPRQDDDLLLEAKALDGESLPNPWLLGLKANKWVLLMAFLGLSYGIWKGSWVAIILSALTLAFVGWVIASAKRHQNTYELLHQSLAQGEFAQTKQHAMTLIELAENEDNTQLKSDAVYRLCLAMASSQHYEDALSLWEAVSEETGVDRAMYLNLRSAIHYAAHSYHACIKDMEAAYQAAPTMAMMQFDLAQIHARVGKTERALDMAKKVNQRELNQIQQAALPMVQGIVDYRENRFNEGSNCLRALLEGMEPYENMAPLWPLLGLIRGYLALCYANLGEKTLAKATLKNWEAVVHAASSIEMRDSLKHHHLIDMPPAEQHSD